MSQWDFGYGREPAEHHEEYPQYPQEAPAHPQYSYPQAPQLPYAQQEPEYPFSAEPQYPWPANAAWPDADQYPGGDGYLAVDEPNDQQVAPYPITYERDEFEGRAPQPGAAPPHPPWPAAPDPADRFAGDPSARQPWRPPPAAGGPVGTASAQAWYPGQPPVYPDDPAYRGPVRPGEEEWDEAADNRGRWMIPAALVVAGAAVGAAVVMFALGHARAAAGTTSPATTASSSAAAAAAASAPAGGRTPPTLAAAKSVLANYTTVNNGANARRSAATLATVETGSSYAIDAGLYTVQAANGTAPYPAFTPVSATYYIPRAEPADGPRWFVVQVANAFSANPGKVTSTEYLLFTQPAAGGAWQNAVEPYLLAGGNAPQIAVGGDGLATAVGASTSLAVAPGQLAARTAAAIDGAGTGLTVTDAGALADRSDQVFWQGRLPTANVTDAHTAATGASGHTYALLTTDGGALVFYTDAAEFAITPPAGSAIHLTVPGFYSPAQALSRAGLSYLDQFATDDPPAGAGTPRVVAEYSGITGKN